MHIDNESFHKLVCEVNGYGPPFASALNAKDVYALALLTRTLIGIFQRAQHILHERRILVMFYVDVRASGEQNLRRFIETLRSQDGYLNQCFYGLGLKEYLYFKHDPESHVSEKPKSYLEEQLVNKFINLDKQLDTRDDLQDKFIQYAMLDEDHDVKIE